MSGHIPVLPVTQETEAGELLASLGQCNETMSQNKKLWENSNIL